PPVTKTDCGRSRSREKKSNRAANAVAVLNTGLNKDDKGATICSTSRETNHATKTAIAFPFPVFIGIRDAGSCPSLPETACERLIRPRLKISSRTDADQALAHAASRRLFCLLSMLSSWELCWMWRECTETEV